MIAVKIYPNVDDREIHQIGADVAVVWNLNLITKETIKDGITYTAQVAVRNREPYIDFIWLRELDGEMHVSEHNPAEGGISAEDALSISRQLAAAVEYMKGLMAPTPAGQ